MRWPTAFLAALLACAGRAEAACDWPGNELLRISGDVEQGDLRGTFSRTLAPASGRFVESIDLGIVKTGTGSEGRLAWSTDVSGASHYLDSDFARRLAVSEAWLSSHLGCGEPADPKRNKQVRVDRTSGQHVWRFTPRGGAPIELWYDHHGGTLDRAVLQYPENRLIHHYSDWREAVPGRRLPFVQRDEDPEDESETVYTVRHVDKVKTASFNPPSLPNDSRIIGGSSTTIKFEDDNRRRIYLPVYLNGKGPFAFELDNGGHFILTQATAKALGLTAEGSFSSTGAGNEIRQAGYVKVDDLRVGNAEVKNQTAKVLPLSHNERPGLLPRAGVLGLEFFERFVVGIDHQTKTVSLRLISDSVGVHPGRALRLVFDEDAPLVSGGYAGVIGNVMLDTGNAGPTIIEAYWASQNGLSANLARGEPRGSAKLSKGIVSLGPFVLRDETISYYGSAERGSENTRSIAAVIGEPLLTRFNAVYDYGHRAVWLDPLPDVPPVSFEKRP
jgi:Aspartyl protease